MKNAIEVENLSKKYSIGEREKYLALRDIMVKAAKVPMNLLKGKKFVKKGEFWALKDVNFTVKQGEVVGIIGRNGAGKSTLLKILSRITEPTHGVIKLNGRISSLLEVGTGFHPELTGRENIYLNGAILGMSRREIDRKFDEIVEFSGVEKFLDMPVKRYSSGMQVRLAFSVAAHLEPDILVIDEVLAVGDAEFQKKCLGKMDEVTREAGRTILFVSHDMGAIQKLCNKTILLEDGQINEYGETSQVIKKYMGEISEKNSYEYDVSDSNEVGIKSISIRNSKEEKTALLDLDESYSIEVEYVVNREFSGYHLALILDSAYGGRVFSTASSDNGILLNGEIGTHRIKFTSITPQGIFLNPGTYWLRVSIGLPNTAPAISVDDIAITLKSPDDNPLYIHPSRKANLNIVDGRWEK